MVAYWIQIQPQRKRCWQDDDGENGRNMKMQRRKKIQGTTQYLWIKKKLIAIEEILESSSSSAMVAIITRTEMTFEELTICQKFSMKVSI